MFAPQSDSIAHNPDLHAVTKNMVHNLGEFPARLGHLYLPYKTKNAVYRFFWKK